VLSCSRRAAQSVGAVLPRRLENRWVAERVRPLPTIEDDPIWELVGIAGPDVEPEEIDEVVYARQTRDPP
jgi:hypothetical protein